MNAPRAWSSVPIVLETGGTKAQWSATQSRRIVEALSVDSYKSLRTRTSSRTGSQPPLCSLEQPRATPSFPLGRKRLFNEYGSTRKGVARYGVPHADSDYAQCTIVPPIRQVHLPGVVLLANPWQ